MDLTENDEGGLTSDYHNLATLTGLLVLCAAGELHPGERALGDGGNEENRGAHPDSCHVGDGNQPPQPIS